MRRPYRRRPIELRLAQVFGGAAVGIVVLGAAAVVRSILVVTFALLLCGSGACE